MRFIAWLITLAENSDRIAEAAADRLRAKLGGHTDMVVRIFITCLSPQVSQARC